VKYKNAAAAHLADLIEQNLSKSKIWPSNFDLREGDVTGGKADLRVRTLNRFEREPKIQEVKNGI